MQKRCLLTITNKHRLCKVSVIWFNKTILNTWCNSSIYCVPEWHCIEHPAEFGFVTQIVPSSLHKVRCPSKHNFRYTRHLLVRGNECVWCGPPKFNSESNVVYTLIKTVKVVLLFFLIFVNTLIYLFNLYIVLAGVCFKIETRKN